MSMIQSDLLLGQEGGAGYVVERSLRFSSIDSAYLSRTPASAGNRKTWTWAGWVKFSSFSNVRLFSAGTDGNNGSVIEIASSGNPCLQVWNYISGYKTLKATNAVFRDPSAWYHIVASCTASTLKIYVNGVESSYSSSTGPDGSDWFFNATVSHNIGKTAWGGEYFNGYLADIHFIDGQALDPSSFVETSATTGQLVPKAYTGSFGTNGFWLKFSDNSAATATTLGKDYSGNSNNWTPNNLSVTAGAGNDSLVDTPSSAGTDTGLGGQVTGNYCTWNPLNMYSAGSGVYSLTNGNLEVVNNLEAYGTIPGTIYVDSGKWYWEVSFSGAQNIYDYVGIQADELSTRSYPGNFVGGYWYRQSGAKVSNADGWQGVSYGASWTSSDIIGVALDADNKTVTFYKNGASQGVAFTGISSTKRWAPAVGDFANAVGVNYILNAGQRPFAYTAPSGFKALCDTNLPAPVVAKPSEVMDVKLWTGNGSSQTISGLGFSPDLVWGKRRNSTNTHWLMDTVRGAGQRLISAETSAEDTKTDILSAFTSDGFSIGSNTESNANTGTYVAWAWDAGSSTVTNTQGSITSQVRANTSAGFSIVTFTGPASAGFGSVGHGLNAKPKFILCKDRSNARNWSVYHESVVTTDYKAFILNSTSAVFDSGTPTWDVSEINSTIFTPYFRDDFGASYNANNVAYCFSPVAGYSSFGSFTGNGSADGPFVYTGFRPRWVLFKSTAAGTYWGIYDAARNTYNAVNLGLYPNDSIAELVDQPFDFLSNGFKVRGTAAFVNSNGSTYIYAAFAEHPFQYARAR